MKETLDKIQAELVKNPNNKYVQLVGSFLIDHVRSNPQDAQLVMAGGKSIVGSLSAMRDEASKQKEGNVGVLTPQEGYDAVLKYFGIAVVVAAFKPVATAGLDISLDDLL